VLSLDDDRWPSLKAGYRVAVDLRPLLRRLETASDPRPAWEETWEELYHQGDVDVGSYVAIPHLVRNHRRRGTVDWNTYALAASVELARGQGGNPDVSVWAAEAYHWALNDLALLGLDELPRANGKEAVRSILGLVAIVFGARTYGRVLVELSEDEVVELERTAFGDEDLGG
jgi:hypothetical protein